MPVYEYECESCDLHFEKLQRFSEDPLRICPRCDGPVHRVIQPVGVIFKGSGFYVTDNRGKSSTMPPGKRDGDSKGEGDNSGSSDKAETKPAAAADTTAPAKTAEKAAD
ncbi:MAG: FmdB family zinc ribbon protein [Caldilineales bacterium]